MDELKINVQSNGDEVFVYTAQGLDVRAPQKINIEGTITAPYEFIKDKPSNYKPHECHLLIDNQRGTLELILNEIDGYENGRVKGQLLFSEDKDKIGVNSKHYSIDSLRQFIQMNPQFFPDQAKRKDILLKLWNFKGQFTTKVENMQNLSTGKRKIALENEITKDVDIIKKFQVKFPVLQGEEARVIDVELFLQIQNDELDIMLYSESLIMLEHEIKDKKLKEVIADIAGIFACSFITIG